MPSNSVLVGDGSVGAVVAMRSLQPRSLLPSPAKRQVSGSKHGAPTDPRTARWRASALSTLLDRAWGCGYVLTHMAVLTLPNADRLPLSVRAQALFSRIQQHVIVPSEGGSHGAARWSIRGRGR